MPKLPLRHLPILLVAGLALPPAARAADGGVDFAREVLPILSDKCFVCHGPDAKKDELRLDSREAATVDLGGYQAIDPEDLGASAILDRIHDSEDPMPPKKAEKRLNDREREILSRWVKGGGDYAKHWAFVPPVKKRALPRESAIDSLVGESLAPQGVALAPEADKATVARRAALVLKGMPPEPEELHTFLSDPSPGAFGRYIDGLLADPKYGEHQARYWLDAVRYGDTHGLHLDNKRGIFPYRDWVVKAYNENLSIDRFITYQFAGDLLPDPSLEQLVATGFVRMNPSTAEGGAISDEFQAKNTFDRTEMLGTVMLGMTMTCARCHTHKYDPITHTDYFGLYAFFNSTAERPLDGNKYDYAPAIKVPTDRQGWADLAKWEAESKAFEEDYRKKEGIEALKVIAAPVASGASRAQELLARWESLQAGFTTTLVAKELDSPRPTKLLHRGEYDQPTGEVIEPRIPAAMGALPDGAPKNRLGLAQWLTTRENPLVARVLINRVWASVFGYGLVRTPEDFGLQGEQPTHPELLDWLAVELIESGWDMKAMLRLMVASKTFKQQSAWREGIDDPDNRLIARGPTHRLDAEVLRDTALWASGLLDPTMGGEGVKPAQPAGLWSALMHPASNTKNYQADTDERVFRRSLYVYWKRTSPHPMMTLFDAPNRESSCVGRTRSNTALQSLGMLNETQRLQAAGALAAQVMLQGEDDLGRIDLLFQRLACRDADSDERETCFALLEAARKRYWMAPADAEGLLTAAGSGVGGGFDPVEHAAWTQLTNVVLASDAAILLY